MPRLEARVKTQLEATTFFHCKGTVVEQTAMIRDLSPGGALLDISPNRHSEYLQVNDIIYLQVKLSENRLTDLVGDISRISAKGYGLTFLFINPQIKSLLWEDIRSRLCLTSLCPFCGNAIEQKSVRCTVCGYHLDFDNPCFLEEHEKETFLPRVHAKTRGLDAEHLVKVINSIDNELLKTKNYEACISIDKAHENDSENTSKDFSNKALLIIHPFAAETEGRHAIPDIFAYSRHYKMAKASTLMAKASETDVPVLIYGESGTGKELTARAIHTASKRKDNAFVPINCAAIPESLLESELFGYSKGAFTGAMKEKKGWIECANGGTLFLDEIGEMVPILQGKLLRFLQSGEYSPVGSTEIRFSDVRILAATNKDLMALKKDGRFRDDLYYRLNVIEIDLPPLRERACDIPALSEHFLNQYGEKYNKPKLFLSREAENLLLNYSYPGNIREMENILHRAVILTESNVIEQYHLPKTLHECDKGVFQLGIRPSFKQAKQEAIETFEKTFIINCLQESHGNISAAANACGMDVKNFHTKMTRYAIDPHDFKLA